MKISQVTIRANREYAPFQHARVEIVAKFDKSTEDPDDICEAVTAYAEKVLDVACARLAKQNANDKASTPY